MSITRFCCVEMEENVSETKLVYYSEVFDEYGLPFFEDNVSIMLIEYCPWCGRKLPCSKREEWFHKLEILGFDNPLLDDNIPIEFKSSKWWEDKPHSDSNK